MVRKDVLVLDHLFDSPITTPTLSGFGLPSNVPTSTLAERILNDPDAWRVLGDGIEPRSYFPLDELEMLEQFSWLERELRPLHMRDTPESKGATTVEADGYIAVPSGLGASSRANDRHETHTLGTPAYGQIQPNEDNFPASIFDAPGGLGVPSHPFAKNVPELEGGRPMQPRSLEPRLNSGTVPADNIQVDSPSTTSSFLKWYDVSPESPHVKTSATGNDQTSSSGGADPPSIALTPHLPAQSSSLTRPVIAGDMEDRKDNDGYDTLKMPGVSITNQQGHQGQTRSLVQDAPEPDASVLAFQSPKERLRGVPGHKISGIPGWGVTVHNYPTKTGPNMMVLIRGSPKPPPAIPIPDTPPDDPLPVPSKEVLREHLGVTPRCDYKANPKGKAPLRRLPSIPKNMKLANQNLEFEHSSGSHLPVIDTPHPTYKYTHTSTSCRSNNPCRLPKRTPRNGARATCARSNLATIPPLDTPLATIRTPPCPAGPRRRH